MQIVLALSGVSMKIIEKQANITGQCKIFKML